MGLSTRTLILSSLAGIFILPPSAQAAPKLRLESTTVGPLSIAVGQNAPAQIIQAYNAGDGNLNLTLSANVTWLSVSVGDPAPCTSASHPGPCVPLQILPATSALAKGVYTATVSVSGVDVLDAPQTITVTVAMGGSVPDSIAVYVKPGGTQTVAFSTVNSLLAVPATDDGHNWISVVTDSGGTFSHSWTYRVNLNAAGLSDGAYSGHITTIGSSLALDNKTIAVSMNVTSQPLLAVSPASLSFRLMQGAFADPAVDGLVSNVALSNAGLGALSVTGATAAPGGEWLSVQLGSGGSYLQLSAKPGSLAPGRYPTTVTVQSNAVNPLSIPVELEVVPTGPPLAYFQGAVNNGTKTVVADDLAQGAIVALYGEHFTLTQAASNDQLTLPFTLNTTRVLVNGAPAPLYYVSNGQINFQMPYETPLGLTVIQVERDGVRGNGIAVNVADIAPRTLIFNLAGQDYAIAINNADGSYAVPTTPGLLSHPATAGDALVIYLTGGGNTDPPAVTGVAAPLKPLSWVPGSVAVSFGSSPQQVTAYAFFAGLTPTYVGLYQVNVYVPKGILTGPAVPLSIQFSGHATYPVMVAIQ